MIDPLGFHHDVAAVYRQVFTQFEVNPAQTLRWRFGFRSDDENHLLHLTESLRPEWLAYIESHVENPGEEVARLGPPTLVVSIDGAYTSEEIGLYYTRLAVLAEENGLRYLGMGVEEPFDPYTGAGWLPLKAAIWQFRVLDLVGDVYVPFVFAIEPSNAKSCNALVSAAEASGFGFVERITAGGASLVLIHITGRNDDDLLRAKYAQIDHLAQANGGVLIGVDYYNRKILDK